MQMDNTDLKILAELQADASLSNVRLAKRVHLSPSACLARVRALERSGVIRQYVALLDPDRLGLPLNVFVFISLKQQSRPSLLAFEAKICARPEVMECYLMTGAEDYLIRVAVSDIVALEQFIIEELSPMPEVEKIRSSFALKQVLYKTALPLDQVE